jgi:hypothetical protein
VTHTTQRLSIGKLLLAAGALAGAIGSIIALSSTVAAWFNSGPEGTVKSLRIQNIRPLTYGEWRDHENASTRGVPAGQLSILGKLITFDIETSGYDENDELPVRIIVHDIARHHSHSVPTDPARVKAGKDCGCFDWVAIPPGRSRYYLEVAVFPPGPIRGDPLKTVSSDYFGPSSNAADHSP